MDYGEQEKKGNFMTYFPLIKDNLDKVYNYFHMTYSEFVKTFKASLKKKLKWRRSISQEKLAITLPMIYQYGAFFEF